MKLNDETVAAYLKAHPDFFTAHADVLPSVVTDGGVVDFQQAMLARLKTDKSKAQRVQKELIETVRANMTNQSRIQTAVLAALEADSFEELITIIAEDFPVILGVDTAMVAIESTSAEIPFVNHAGIRFTRAGLIEKWLGAGDVLLQGNIAGDPDIFGPGAGLVRSQALIRLEVSEQTPRALLAFGSRDPLLFQPHQAVDQIGFLSQAIERILRIWLNT